MFKKLMRSILALDLEEKILNLASLICVVAVFFPWISGEWLGGENVLYTGFGFYTSFIGTGVFLINVFILLLTILPLSGGPTLIKKRSKDIVRFFAASISVVLLLSALSVLTKVTFEFSRVEVRFGILLSLIASMVVLLYAYLQYQVQRKNEVHEFFHHPEDDVAPISAKMPDSLKNSGVKAPPPLSAEDHRMQL